MFVTDPKIKPVAPKMDWLALALLIAAIGSLQSVLEKGQSEDWFETRYITGLAWVAGIAGIFFVARELIKKDPIINLRLFSNRPFATGTMFNFILGFGLYGTTLVIPIFCQGLLGFTAMQTGLVMLPGSLATALMMPIVGTMLKRRLVHPAVYAGLGLFLFFIFSRRMGMLNTQVGEWDFFVPLIIRGFAMGLIFIPLTTISLSELEGAQIPQGTALSNMIRQLGGSIGIALITTFISRDTAKHYAYLNENVTAGNFETQQRINMLTGAFVGKGYDVHAAQATAYNIISKTIFGQATFLTYKDLFIYLGAFFLLLIPLLIMFKAKKKKAKISEEQVEWSLE
jgi:DHA2 family multidrug resistance protein